MQIARTLLSVCLATACLGANALGNPSGIYVEKYTGCSADPWEPAAKDANNTLHPNRAGCSGTQAPGYTTNTSIDIYVDSANRVFRVYSVTPTSVSIGNITILNPNSHPFTLLVGTQNSAMLSANEFTSPSQTLNFGAVDVGSITESTSTKYGTIQVCVKGSTGAISVKEVIRVDAATAINGNITAATNVQTVKSPSINGDITATTGGVGNVIVNSWDSSSPAESDFTRKITANWDSSNNVDAVSTVSVYNAHFRGDIEADNGRIGSIIVRNNGGDPINSISKTSGTVSIRAKLGIRRVEAGSISANLTANYNSGTGTIGRVVASTGDFSGSLTATSLPSLDLAASPPTGLISVAGTLAAAITFASSGLSGQIIANAGGSGGWTGTVTVGSTTLNPTSFTGGAYTTTSSSLGGGSVGLAPFKLHKVDCVPVGDADGDPLIASTTTVVNSSFVSTVAPIKLAFYGPVRRTSSSPSTWSGSVLVESTSLSYATSDPCSDSAQWQDVTSAFVVYGPNNTTAGTNARSVALGSTLNGGTRRKIAPGLYRVSVNDVLSSFVSGTPSVEISEYCPSVPAFYFRVGFDCDNDGQDKDIDTSDGTCTGCFTADFNDNAVLEVQDIFDFLNAWFAGCTSNVAPCTKSADFNAVDGLSVQDIFDFLNAWFAATPC